MSRLVTIRVTKAEAVQLHNYVCDRDMGPDCGWYYGKKEDFERRHASLKEILERAISKASTSSAVQGEP